MQVQQKMELRVLNNQFLTKEYGWDLNYINETSELLN